MANNNQDTTYDIMCPFCFKRYTNFNALFADHRHFSDEIYPGQVEYMRHFLGTEPFGGREGPVYFRRNPNDPAGNVFAATTENGDVTRTRVCPYCYNMLPAAAGRVKPFSIAVMGSDDAERSFYIGAALHRMNSTMLANYGAAFIPADYRTASFFCEQYEEPLYADRTVPEALTTITPLVYEFARTGASAPEEWKGSTVTYNNALFYIYNIDRELVDRYPMIAYNAIAQAGALILISDAAAQAASDDPLCDPWLGYLTETMRRIFGPMSCDKPAAIVLSKSDKAEIPDKKWAAALKSVVSQKLVISESLKKVFPTTAFAKFSDQAAAVLRTRLPGFSSVIESLFSKENTMFFPVPEFFETHGDGTADIKEPAAAEASFLWLLAKLGLLPNSSAVIL